LWWKLFPGSLAAARVGSSFLKENPRFRRSVPIWN
jgi:hypothetical protein